MSRIRAFKTLVQVAVTSGVLAVGALAMHPHPAWGNGLRHIILHH